MTAPAIIGNMFVVDYDAGAKTFTIETISDGDSVAISANTELADYYDYYGVGAGSIGADGKTLTVTKAGVFKIGLTTAQTATHAAGAKVTTYLVVEKGVQDAPTGLGKTDATTHGGNDGKITGLDTTKRYEYCLDGADSYITVTAGATQITGLTAGTYFVIFAENDLYFAGADSAAVVISNPTDTTPPTGTITIKSNGFVSFLNTITFGLFFKNSVSVTITGADADSGVKTVEYLQSTTNYDSAAAMSGLTWTTATNGETFNIATKWKGYIYARITDNADNVTVIRSDGVVVYEDSAQDTTNISFTKGGTSDVTADVTLNGNTIEKIMNGAATLTSGSDYTVSGGTITFKASYLDSLDANSYTLTVYYNPQGEAFVTAADNDTPETTTITLTVNAQQYTVEVLSAGTGAAGGGSFIEGATVTIDAGTPPDSSMQFKNWTASPAVTFDDANSASTTFTMIASAVTITANFEAIPATVTAVTVNPSSVTVEKGTSYQFGATVTGTNNPEQTVTWSVNSADGSTIAADGTLNVAAGETAETLTVTANSTVAGYTSVSGTATVTVSDTAPPEPTVTSVTVTPATITLNKGDSHTFSATVDGDNKRLSRR
ncbi:hypothetical protein FACS189425_01150 [Clostridia bacterium]|nr:hypothetical protein FACS189425_01150 [Clostridia bacterium]